MHTAAHIVLLVDADPGDALRFHDAIQAAGLPLALYVVADGDAALDFLRRRPPFEDAPRPDLVFLETRLPRRDGAAVLAALDADRHLRTLPVIVFTADDDADAGRHCVVRKPADLEGLVRILRAVDAFWFRTASRPDRQTVRPSVCPSVRPSVRPIVRPIVRRRHA